MEPKLSFLNARRLVPIAWVSSGRARNSEVVDWVARRTPRERVLLLTGAAVIVLASLVSFVWLPLASAREEELGRILVLERTIARARTIDPANVPEQAAPLVPAATTVTNSAAEYGLAIRRLESEGAQTRVALDDVRFDTLIGWLDALERMSGLRVTDIELERRPEPGVVTARLVLER